MHGLMHTTGDCFAVLRTGKVFDLLHMHCIACICAGDAVAVLQHNAKCGVPLVASHVLYMLHQASF